MAVLRSGAFAVLSLVIIQQFAAVEALVISEPCCYSFPHQISSIGPKLPCAGSEEGSVEGILLETSSLCSSTAEDLNSSIALVPRGGCKFVTKILNAQAAGAVAVIIFENNPSFPDALLTMDADDETGVEIPSAFISYNTYLELTDLFNETDVYAVLNATNSFGGERYLLYEYWMFVILISSFTLVLVSTSMIVLLMGCSSKKSKPSAVAATGPVQGDTLAGSIMLAEDSEDNLGKGPVAASNPRYKP